jgi:hypothetical protein
MKMPCGFALGLEIFVFGWYGLVKVFTGFMLLDPFHILEDMHVRMPWCLEFSAVPFSLIVSASYMDRIMGKKSWCLDLMDNSRNFPYQGSIVHMDILETQRILRT